MPNEYLPYDVFLGHSSKDKPTVRELAVRLRGAGLNVWFDELCGSRGSGQVNGAPLLAA